MYYFVGPSLITRTLADAMMAVHPQTAMQLDINNYWVHFIVIKEINNQLQGVPLFPKDMAEHKDRYLYAYPRDFFYVTSASGP